MGCIMFIGTPRGAYTSIARIYLQGVYRVFPRILSEYIALKYSPIVVYKDFGDFLAFVYIVYRIPPLAHA